MGMEQALFAASTAKQMDISERGNTAQAADFRALAPLSI
jgi:hypothetical protein